jgi:hypothetical protein
MAKVQSASVSTLNALHEAVARYMLMRIQSAFPDPDAEVQYDEETGEEIHTFFIPLAASELQVFVSFLDKNNITATPDVEHMKELADEFTADLKLAREQKAQAIVKVNENDAALAAFLS